MTSDTVPESSGQAASGNVMPNLAAIQHYCELVMSCALVAVPLNERAQHVMTLVGKRPEPAASGDRFRVARFTIGKSMAMAQTAARWSREDGMNVYLAPVVYRKTTLKRRSRGMQEDIAFVLGVGCDVDADHGQNVSLISMLRPLPSVTMTTSVGNAHGVYLFKEPVPVSYARQLVASLAKFVGDKELNAHDPNHIWRVPGTLYYTTADKAKRRGLSWPVAPRVVTVDIEICQYRPVDARELADFLATEADSEDERAASENGPRELGSRWQIGREVWNEDERELTRLIDALRHLDKVDQASRAGGPPIALWGVTYDLRTRATWLMVGMALHVFMKGSERGFDLWRSVSAGDAMLGFTGEPERWNERDARERWISFASPGGRETFYTVNTLFKLANNFGFDNRRVKYGLSPLPTKTPAISRRGQAVADAGRAFHALSVTTESGGRDLRSEAKDAHRRLAHRSKASRRELAVLQLIYDDLHGRDDGKGPVGVAYRGGRSYCAELSDGSSAGWDNRDLWRAVKGLVRLELLIASSGNEIGAHGRKGASYALTLPHGMTWAALIEDRRQRLSHRPESGKKGREADQILRQKSAAWEGYSASANPPPSPPLQGDPASANPTMHTNWREFQGGEEGPSKFNLAQWLAWDGMPRDTGEVLRCARAKSRSKAPDRVVAKLNRIVAAGISPDLLSIELWRVHEGMLHMRHATDPERVLRRLFEEVCLMAGKFGVDVIDADAVKRARAERKANHEQWRRQTSHEPGPESMPQDYRAAKDGESS